jgi:uncharacterized OB-fold protein
MALLAQDRELPAPHVTPEVEEFFRAAGVGRLLIKTCDECGKPHFYPRAICPHCFSSETRWLEASGRGRIYTFSVARRGVPVPFAIAYVTLEEGVTMMTNIVDCDLDALRIEMPVRVVFKATTGNGPVVPMFTPVPDAAARGPSDG